MPITPLRPIRIVQLTDPHLSTRHPQFLHNWDRLLEQLGTHPPDRVIVTGDLAYDGAGRAEDLAFARTQLDRLPAPWLVLPGNHDIGETVADPAVPPKQAVTPERLERWLKLIGPDHWVEQMGGWRLLGLNTQLLGSALPGEATQADWLERTLAEGEYLPTALFLHKPLYHLEPETSPRSIESLWPEHRHWLAELCQAHGVRMVASGHTHSHRMAQWRGLSLVWAPPCSFVVPSRRPPQYLGESAVGYAEHLLHPGGGVDSRIVLPTDLVAHDFESLTDGRRIPYLALGAE